MKDSPPILTEIISPTPSSRPDDGSDGSHYDIKLDNGRLVIEAQDLIESLNLNHGMGECFCAIIRMGRKPGESKLRALKKIEYYTKRAIKLEQNK